MSRQHMEFWFWQYRSHNWTFSGGTREEQAVPQAATEEGTLGASVRATFGGLDLFKSEVKLAAHKEQQ